MKFPTVLTIILAAVAATFAILGSTASAQQSACEPNPSPVDAADPSVIVSEPSANDSVTSPVHVEGQARVFEANVSIAIYDANGDEIVSTFTSAAEGGVLSPFSTDVSFSVSTSTPACLWVFETSAQDGSAVNVVQVPLTLEATTTLPSTGHGATTGSEPVWLWLAAGLALGGAVLVGLGVPLRRRA